MAKKSSRDDELRQLQRRLEEAEEALRVIREGEVDAILVKGPHGDQVFSLSETENVYRMMIETMNEAGLTVSFSGTVIYANDRFAEMLKLDLSRVVGARLSNFAAEGQQAELERLLLEAQERPTDGRVMLLAADGTPLPLHIWANSIEAPAMPLVCVVGTDLSQLEASKEMIEHLREQQRELQRVMDELRRSNQELEHFAYIASHDLQEPLRMVSSFMDLLRERYRGRLDERADQYINFALDGVSRMRQLIDDLLVYGRVDRMESRLEPMPVASALESAKENLQKMIEQNGAEISSDPLPQVMADRTQLTMMFQNLLSNAIKFHRPEVPPRVHVSAERQDGRWIIAVRDNGIGIPPAQQERIFMLFQRLHTRSEYPGTGLGLAICRRIAERHGGQLSVESEVGKGTTFYFSLAEVPAETAT